MSYVSCVGQLHAVSFAHDCASFRLIILCFRSARWCLESCCLEPRCFDCSNGDHLVAWYPKRTQSSEVPVDGRRQVRVTNDIAVVHEGAHNLGDGHAPLIAAARSGLDLHRPFYAGGLRALRMLAQECRGEEQQRLGRCAHNWFGRASAVRFGPKLRPKHSPKRTAEESQTSDTICLKYGRLGPPL